MKSFVKINRKGQEFGVWLMLFIYLGAIILIFWRYSSEFSMPKDSEGIGFRQNLLYVAYGVASQTELYEETLAKERIYTTIREFTSKGFKSSITKEIVENNCGRYGYELWSTKEESCIPSLESDDILNELEKSFEEKLQNNNHFLLRGIPQNVEVSDKGEYLEIYGKTTKDIVLPLIGVKDGSYSKLPEIYQTFSSEKRPSSILSTGEGVLRALPVDNPVITSCYGRRIIDGKEDFHEGIDFRGNEGDKVYAVADGIVIKTCDKWKGDCYCSYLSKGSECEINCAHLCTQRGTGNEIKIKHSDNLYSIYWHLKDVFVKEGDVVKAGQVIGAVGNTGHSQKAHLHLSIAQSLTVSQTTSFNPLCLFPQELISKISLAAESCSEKYGDTLEYIDVQNDISCKGVLTEELKEGMESITGAVAIENTFSCPGSEVTLEITHYKAPVITKDKPWCSIAGCHPKASDYYGLSGTNVKKSCLEENKGFCCISNRGIYEEAKCQGTVYYKGKKYRYDTVTPTPPPDFESEQSLTSYCAQTSTGTCATKKRTIAVDPSVIPYGSYVCINFDIGNPWTGCYIAEDTGSGLKGYHVDIFGGYTEEELEETKYLKGWATACIYPPGSNIPIVPPKKEGEDSVVVIPKKIFGEVISVRGIGEYRFRPGFSIEVPNIFAGHIVLSQWSQQVLGKCKDNVEQCLKSEIFDFNSKVKTFKIYTPEDEEYKKYCEQEEDSRLLLDFSNYVDNCYNNKQKDCYCKFEIPLRMENIKDASLRLSTENIELRHKDKPTKSISTKANLRRYVSEEGIIESGDEEKFLLLYNLNYEDGKLEDSFIEKNFVVEEDSKKTMKKETIKKPYETFILYKDKEDSVAIEVKEKKETPFCGYFKDSFRLCAVKNIKDPLFNEKVGENMIIKFALQLEDTTPPEQISDLTATKSESSIDISFSPSPSADLSYYKIYCSFSPVSDLKQANYTITTQTYTQLKSCENTPITNQNHYIIITAVDKAGNENTKLSKENSIII